jgi:hypothetical protein
MARNLLSAADLLAGSKALQDVTIPAAVLQPAALRSGEAGGEDPGSDEPSADAYAPRSGCVRMRPLSIAVLSLISRAAREDPALIPLLMIKEAVVEPQLTLDQIRQMHVGLVYYLVEQVNRLSGLAADGATADEAVYDAVDSPLGRTHLLLAKHFGWTPEQVGQLTPGQVAVYLAGIEKLLQLENSQVQARKP